MTTKNLAIIAHVDHGKTTLIDSMLKQSGTFRENMQVSERVMDSNDLEKERGITILAKCTSLEFNNHHLNIIDTPGHADFGGEVERVLNMVDGVLLLVDAAEGPMPQTKFVLTKALALGLKPIVVINKIDRNDARPDEVLNEIFDLFVALNASDDQLDFEVLYASGRSGWATKDLKNPSDNLTPLFETIISVIPEPKIIENQKFAMLVTLLDSDPYLGRILTGKIYSGKVDRNMMVKVMGLDGKEIERGKVTKLLAYRGIERVPVETAEAGDIIAIAGLVNATVADTICDLEVVQPIPTTPIDPPTMAISLRVNDSPLAGTEGDKVTSRVIRDRLFKEAEKNIAIKVTESADNDSFEVGGRGELQLGILLETMRREGFELCVSRPRVIFKEENGVKYEPCEEVFIDVDEEYSGVVVEKLTARRGELNDLRPTGKGKIRVKFIMPTRGMIGYHNEFLNDTRGTGVLNRIFYNYEPVKSNLPKRKNGVLISMADGKAVAYALWNLEERGELFVLPQESVYKGMIVGLHTRDNDLEVNPLKGKQLTNIRTTSKDEAVKLRPIRPLTIEQAISFIEDDELIEITPKSIRLRKEILDSNDRKRLSRG